MSIKRIAIISNDIVIGIWPLDDSDEAEAAMIAGFLSEPTPIEIDSSNQASLGWKYENGITYKEGQ